MRTQLFASSLCGLLLLAAAATVEAGVELDAPPAVQGEAATLVVTKNNEPLGEQLVKVTYYPNSEIKRTVEVGRTDARGRVEWTPAHAGMAAISAGDQNKTFGVRFPAMPIGAVVVFLIAGTLLFGGIAIGVKKLTG